MPDTMLEAPVCISYQVAWKNEIIFPQGNCNLAKKKMVQLSIPYRFYGSKIRLPYLAHDMDSMNSATPGSGKEGTTCVGKGIEVGKAWPYLVRVNI